MWRLVRSAEQGKEKVSLLSVSKATSLRKLSCLFERGFLKKTHTLAVKSAAATCTSPAVFCDREKDETDFLWFCENIHLLSFLHCNSFQSEPVQQLVSTVRLQGDNSKLDFSRSLLKEYFVKLCTRTCRNMASTLSASLASLAGELRAST